MNEENKFEYELSNKKIAHRFSFKITVRTHSGEKPKQCNLLNNVSAHSGNMENEAQSSTGETSCKCPLCHKVFARENSLRRHVRTHNGEKPYKCDICGKAYTQSGSLKSHKRTHTGEMSYRCNLCQKLFTCKNHLDDHTITHTGENLDKFNLCDKSYSIRQRLKYHTGTHPGEKPYKCYLCDKAYAHIGTLKNHMRSHTGEKPYECELCGKTFASSKCLKYHAVGHAMKNMKHISTSELIARLTRGCRGSSSPKSSSMHTENDRRCYEKVLPATETMQDISCDRRTIKYSPNEKPHSRNQSITAADLDPLTSKLYGCGICNERFEIEKEFVEHCFLHCGAPQKDTYVDLLRHLSSCPCGEQTQFLSFTGTLYQQFWDHLCIWQFNYVLIYVTVDGTR